MPLPLFGNKFSPKKTPPRRTKSLSNLRLDADTTRQEFGPEINSSVRLNLGSHEVAFENGMWVNDSPTSGGNPRELIFQKRENQQVTDENHLLKLKVEMLLDLLAEQTANANYLESELRQLRGTKKR